MHFIYERLISVLVCFGYISLLYEFLFAGKWNASKYVFSGLASNPLKSIWTKWGNVALYCIAVTLQCDPLCRSQWPDTISFYLVLKGPAQHFFSRPVVKNMGTEWWWLCLYCWRSPAHTSVPCTALSLTSWPDRATSTPSFMNHALWTHTALHMSYLLAGCLCCGRLRLFVLRSSTLSRLKLKCNTANHKLQ